MVCATSIDSYVYIWCQEFLKGLEYLFHVLFVHKRFFGKRIYGSKILLLLFSHLIAEYFLKPIYCNKNRPRILNFIFMRSNF